MFNVPKIILVIEDNRAHGRSLLRGISRYAVLHGPWNLYRDAYNPSYGHGASIIKEVFVQFDQLGCDGLITRNPNKTAKITARGIPTIIAITEKDIPEDLPYLSINHQTVGQMAAEYLLEKGYTNYAFCGYRNMYWSQMRGAAFAEHIKKTSNCMTNFYQPPSTRKLKKLKFKSEIEHIAAWLNSLPKPVGIMACNDNRASEIIEAAKFAQINVPEEISILGVDNDDLICNMCNPPLSSIQLDAEQGGYRAAELMDNLVSGKTKMACQKILIEPIHIVERLSTDILAVSDPDVAKAMNFIKQNRKYPVQVNEVIEATYSSRRSLQQKFRKHLDRTIFEEIAKTRIDYIKQLLLDTDFTISQIAQMVNMPSISQLSRFFQKQTGISPLKYRRTYKSSQL